MICTWCHQIHRTLPRLRFQCTPLGRRLQLKVTAMAHQSVVVGCLILSLPLALTCVGLWSSHFPFPGLIFLNYSKSTDRHQGCGDCCNTRMEGTTGAVTARRAVVWRILRLWLGTEGRNAGWMTKVCPGSTVKGAGTVPLTSFLDYVKSKGTSSLNTLLFFVCLCCVFHL